MSERPDPYELLRHLNPIGGDRVTAQDEARLEAILGGNVDSGVDANVDGSDELATRRRARRLVAAAVLVAAVAGTAAWAILRSEPATDPAVVECRPTASLDGDRTLVSATGDPVADCAPLWSDGTFSSAGTPELTVCVRDGGAAVVFPADRGVCERLGLASFGEPTEDAGAVRELQARLRVAFGAVCVTKDEATAIVERTIDELGLVGWTVDFTGPFTAERPCAVVGVDAAARAVHLVGLPAAVPMPPASVTP